jgi:AcrR family transcriptional regulator
MEPTADPPPEPAPSTKRSDRTKAKILDAAEEVFGRRGFHGSSIVEITRQAGVGLGTFYLYFPSKIEIYRHLLRARQEDFIRAAREATTGAGDQREVIRRAFRSFFDWIAQRPAVMRLLREAEFVDPTLLISLYDAPAAEYRERLGRAMKLGYIKETDPAVLAWCLMGMAEFSVLKWVVWPGAEQIDDERFEAFVEIFARAVGATAAG